MRRWAAWAGIAAGVLVFGGIANQASHNGMQTFDRALLLAFRNPDLSPAGPAWLADSARDITALGGPAVLTLVTIAAGALLLMEGKNHLALFLYASVGSGFLAAMILKSLFERPRPDLVPHAAYVATASFPSGHSMLSAVTYLTMGALLARSHKRKRIKAYFLIVAAVLTLLIGVSRVYLGVHWPTDVLAGWAAGWAWALGCWLAARRLQMTKAIEGEDYGRAEL